MLRRVLVASQALAAAANVALAKPPRTCVAPECPFPSSILRESQRHLESAVNYSTSMDVVELARSVEALMPVVDVLASFVAKPLRKDSGNLQRAATSRDIVGLEGLVAREREVAGKRDSVVATSAYWSYLFLDFFERLLRGVEEQGDAAFDPDVARDDGANAVIRDSAQRAYDAVYAPQHNFLVRKIARGVLSFIPHRERFFVAFGTSGSDRKEWKRALKDELTSFLGALRKCNKRLQDHFATDGIPENL